MMPGSYTDEFEDDEQQKPPPSRLGSPAAQVVLPAPTIMIAAPPDPRVELQRRLDLAQVYQSLVAEPLFEKATAASKIVEDEVRNFIYSRLQALIGQESKTAASGEFSPEEVAALKAIARSLLSRQQPAPAADAPAAPPQPRKGKRTPKAEPAEVKPPEPVRVRRKQAPTSLSESAPLPPAPAAVPAPAAQAAPAPTAAPAPAAPIAEPGAPTVGAEGKLYSPRVYKIRVVGEDGVQREKEVRLNVTPQAKPVGTPMHKTPVSNAEQQMVNARAEMEAVEHAEGFTEGLRRAPTLPISRRAR